MMLYFIITEKAEAMKLFDGVGREHEEFKLNLNKDKEVQLAQIHVQKDIAASQAHGRADGRARVADGEQVWATECFNPHPSRRMGATPPTDLC